RDYLNNAPNLADVNQLVSFGTSGHRGTPTDGTFTQTHILAITQAIVEYRSSKGITGPLFIGKDTHAASGPAQRTAVEVLAANRTPVGGRGPTGGEPGIQAGDGYPPPPVIPHPILPYNKGRQSGLADGIVIPPSHTPPADGGFKYNPPNGGPADTDVTDWVQA